MPATVVAEICAAMAVLASEGKVGGVSAGLLVFHLPLFLFQRWLDSKSWNCVVGRFTRLC